MTDDIVISGMGVLSPIGSDESSFWDALTAGRSGAAPITSLDTTELTRKIACEVKEPVAADRPMGRASALAVKAAKQAVAQARLSADELRAARTHVIVGTTMGETQFIEDRLFSPPEQWLTPEHVGEIARGRPGCIARNVRESLGMLGAGYDLYGACAAANLAIATARRHLLEGRCDVALVGGADGFSRLAFIGFMRLRVMAAEVCRPFDEARDGLLVGEGAAMFVLERESSARARGAKIRARVSGCSIASENYHPTRPAPDGDGLTRATLEAIRQAGLSAADVQYVCAHGTGTPQNDMIEVRVLNQCFPGGVAFSSIKALTGHTMGAAAGVEAAACVLMLENQKLIPTWHLSKVLQPCELDAVQGAVRDARVKHVVNNSAGFGGYNSSIVLSAA
jgi:3-oxoacyl-[acyl-carrier-protein] synthase II